MGEVSSGEDSIVGGQQCGITIVEEDNSGNGSSVEGNSVGGQWGRTAWEDSNGGGQQCGGQPYGRTAVGRAVVVDSKGDNNRGGGQ